MKMVGHQAKNWAGKSVSECRVRKQFAKSVQEFAAEPTGPAIEDRLRPVDDCVTLISFGRQSLQMIPVCSSFKPV